jgi:hypothetical protein
MMDRKVFDYKINHGICPFCCKNMKHIKGTYENWDECLECSVEVTNKGVIIR